MTARGPESIPSSPGGMLWSLVIVVASVAGGLAAAALVPVPSIWIAVAIPAIIGPVVAQAVLYRRPGLEQERRNGPDSASRSESRPEVPSGRHDGHYRGHERPALGPAPAEPAAMVQVLPVPAAPAADTPWWAAARDAAARALQRRPCCHSRSINLPGLGADRAMPSLWRVQARYQARSGPVGMPLRIVRAHLDLAARNGVAPGPRRAPAAYPVGCPGPRLARFPAN
jgi:hypothetical protein